MKTKTILSLQFNGKRIQVVEISYEWQKSVTYDVLQNRRKRRVGVTKESAAYEVMNIIRDNFCI